MLLGDDTQLQHASICLNLNLSFWMMAYGMGTVHYVFVCVFVCVFMCVNTYYTESSKPEFGDGKAGRFIRFSKPHTNIQRNICQLSTLSLKCS